jgi:carbonic anhydrase
MDPTAALKQLREGNARYVAGSVTLGQNIAQQRAALAQSQSPIAVVVACADSRVAPELVFDQGLGKLFVVRTAGNLVDKYALGSIEYAVEHLGVRLIVVLGHERCGAVKAAVSGDHASGNLAALVGAITKNRDAAPDPLDASVIENARAVTSQIRAQAKLPPKTEVKFVAARYDLDSGEVTEIR